MCLWYLCKTSGQGIWLIGLLVLSSSSQDLAWPKAWSCSWLWGHTGHAYTASGDFRASGLWNKPWLSQELPGEVAWVFGSPEYLPMEHSAQEKGALLGWCLWLCRVLKSVTSYGNRWIWWGGIFWHKCLENPLLSLTWRDNCKTKAWEAVWYLLLRCSCIRTKC